MKLIRPAILVLLFSFLIPGIGAQEAGKAPGPVSHLVGAMGGMNLFNGHLALGKLYEGDLSTEEKMNAAFRKAGSIVGGTEAVIDSFNDALSSFPVAEQDQIKELIKGHQLLIEEAEALKKFIQAKYDGAGASEAEVQFKAKRTEVTGIVAGLLGIETSTVE